MSKSSSSNAITCCVCLETPIPEKMIKLVPCKHACLCIPCFLQASLQNPTSFQCPVCWQPVKHIIFNGPVNTDRKDLIVAPLIDDENSTKLFNSALSYLGMLKKVDQEEIACIFLLDICRSFLSEAEFNHAPLHLPLITVVQCEILLAAWNAIKSEGAFMTEKILVAMCRYPWLVDRNLAQKAGICYHGNFGENPDSLKHTLEILLRNWKSMYSLVSFRGGASPFYLF